MASNSEANVEAFRVNYAEVVGTPIPCDWGEKPLHEHSTPNRFLWVPAEGPVRSAQDAGEQPQDPRQAPPILAWRYHAFNVYCWGADAEAADLLHHNLISVLMQNPGPANIVWGTFRWLTEQPETASWLNRGAVIRQQLQIRTYVGAPLTPTVTISEIGHEGYIGLEGSEEGCGCGS